MPLIFRRKGVSGALVALAIGLTVSAAAIFHLRTPQNTLPISAMRVAGEMVNVEVARSNYELAKGMMFRKDLAADAGMMFVFDQPSVQCFPERDRQRA
jgi:hypothetical protein